ncbi:MAG: winged helix-turn-helix transcriptional regulator [Oscillibacter sp.]|jgi:DNA-binding MarR family transcriptional regulator|uniref:MarR family winged helix-turn-helix transcriptional regulator n=1 Tax=Oscillibacter sp. TaxID=1945593 RepID=UPI00217107E7|nr:MarR family winged helix-turn-helix transcriptional regulator [Oscillibacter sp.]MCI8840933.1 winged helix-turn-helix transcriptional regulator [Oscillibacter sp.]MCI9113694.1 winged helix-turn-helix transcriptional regulator [Oscillibacter sp.]
MPTEAFWTGGAPPGTVRDQEELQRFLTKRKQEVLSELYRSGRLSQGELANRVHAKPTALSNILQKLDSFSPKLIKKDYEGKYCFYTLTEFGRKLMEKEPEAVQTQKSRLLQDREDEVLFQMAYESLHELGRSDEKQTLFDDVMVFYVRGARVIPNRKYRRLVNQYLRSLELLALHQNERLFNQTLKLLTNPHDNSRVTEFIDDYFTPFSPVLRTLQEKGQELQISRILRSVFTGQTDETVEHCIQAVGWDEESLQEMKTAAKRIKLCLMGCGLEEIYDYFTALLPDQEMLSASLSQWL